MRSIATKVSIADLAICDSFFHLRLLSSRLSPNLMRLDVLYFDVTHELA